VLEALNLDLRDAGNICVIPSHTELALLITADYRENPVAIAKLSLMRLPRPDNSVSRC